MDDKDTIFISPKSSVGRTPCFEVRRKPGDTSYVSVDLLSMTFHVAGADIMRPTIGKPHDEYTLQDCRELLKRLEDFMDRHGVKRKPVVPIDAHLWRNPVAHCGR